MPWAPDYVTTAELRDYLHIPDNDDDAELALAISAASRAVDRAANRQFGVVASVEARSFDAVYDRHSGLYVVEIDDLMTSTGLTIEDTQGASVVVSDVTLKPRNAPQKGAPWTRFTMVAGTAGPLEVTALWGWSAVPAAIEQATLIQASRFFKRRESPFGVAGSPDLGSEFRLQAKVDPDVEVMIGPYRRWWAVA
jgi:hypothetical protein